MAELGQETTTKKGRKAKVVAETKPVAAKVLLAIASTKPAETIEVSGETVIQPTATKNAVNKRALAVALYEVACQLLGTEGALPRQIASLGFVRAGGAFCHGSATALKGEVKENKGAPGYIDLEAAWWAKLAGDNHAKVAELVPFVKSVYRMYGSDALEGTTEQKFASLEKALKG